MTSPVELQNTVSSFLVPLRVAAMGPDPFQAAVQCGGTADLGAGTIRSTPHRVVRELRPGSSGDPEVFKITLHRRGTAMAGHDGEQRPVRTGDLLVLDTRRPYVLALPDECDVAVLRLPGPLLGPHAKRLEACSGASLPADSGLAAVFARFASALSDDPELLCSATMEHLADSLVSLLIAMLADIAPERVETPAGDLLDRLVAYTLANLNDPGLSPESVAHRHRISRRHLDKLFTRRELPFTEWVRAERLNRIRRDLMDPSLRHRSAATIAASWGLMDSSHLARSLKKRFGRTAAELRGAVHRAAGSGPGA